jgi:hypothetical protein
MKNVKSILVKLDLKGHGIVNFDKLSQKYMFQDKHNNGVKHHLYTPNDNAKYSKKNFYYGADGSLDYKIKISSECIKKSMFSDDYIAQSTKIVHNPVILNSYISSPMSHIRGYMFADKVSLKRKSALTIEDAEATNNVKSYLDFGVLSGDKHDDSKGDNESGIGIHVHENVGDIEYSTRGIIDLEALQFVSCDQVFDRYAFNPDDFGLYKKFMKQWFGDFDEELAYYVKKGSVCDIPELGFVMSDKDVLFLVRGILTRMLKTRIRRNNAIAEVTDIKIKLVSDPISDTFYNESNWTSVSSLIDVENLTFQVNEFYDKIDFDQARQLRDELLEDMKDKKKSKSK